MAFKSKVACVMVTVIGIEEVDDEGAVPIKQTRSFMIDVSDCNNIIDFFNVATKITLDAKDTCARSLPYSYGD